MGQHPSRENNMQGGNHCRRTPIVNYMQAYSWNTVAIVKVQ
ncbi:MAG: hypothetical protein WBF90_27665 [Rivularia sp. (in: cyanobacteria)]